MLIMYSLLVRAKSLVSNHLKCLEVIGKKYVINFGESHRMYLCKNQANAYKNITYLVIAISTWDFHCLSQCIPHFDESQLNF